jgi:REP element-mobilizing transposase RayT
MKGRLKMPRKKRVWYPGAAYHIYCRGNRKSLLFRNKKDYRYYLYFLEQSKLRYFYDLFAYCLMPNHIHLQIKTKEIEIWEIMRWVNLTYAKYFNSKYDLVGHLFQGRYGSNLIKDDAHNVSTSRYIHLNPVEAEIVKDPAEYRWSSYDVYLGIRYSELVDEDYILSYYQNSGSEGYKKYIEAGL